MLVTADDSLKEYIATILQQVQEWLLSAAINRLVLAIKSLETNETLERWQFDIQQEEVGEDGKPVPKPAATTAGGAGEPGAVKRKGKEKTEKEVQGEIREIMKQITSSVTFLPILEEPCELHWPLRDERLCL